jgi:adenylosuccinate synthase
VKAEAALEAAEYEELPGFEADLSACREESDLPTEARDYLGFIAEVVGVPVRLIGVGPDRDQVVWIGVRGFPAPQGGRASTRLLP